MGEVIFPNGKENKGETINEENKGRKKVKK